MFRECSGYVVKIVVVFVVNIVVKIVVIALSSASSVSVFGIFLIFDKKVSLRKGKRQLLVCSLQWQDL